MIPQYRMHQLRMEAEQYQSLREAVIRVVQAEDDRLLRDWMKRIGMLPGPADVLPAAPQPIRFLLTDRTSHECVGDAPF